MEDLECVTPKKSRSVPLPLLELVGQTSLLQGCYDPEASAVPSRTVIQQVEFGPADLAGE